MTLAASLERLRAAYPRVILCHDTDGPWVCSAHDRPFDPGRRNHHAQGATPEEAVANCVKMALPKEGTNGSR